MINRPQRLRQEHPAEDHWRLSSHSWKRDGQWQPRSLIELGAGFHHEVTERENILLNGLLMGYSKDEMKVREQSIIDFADIGEFMDAPIKQYSSGMHTRLAFAVATDVNPDILLVDEILAVADAAFQEKCFARIENFRKAERPSSLCLTTCSRSQSTAIASSCRQRHKSSPMAIHPRLSISIRA